MGLKMCIQLILGVFDAGKLDSRTAAYHLAVFAPCPYDKAAFGRSYCKEIRIRILGAYGTGINLCSSCTLTRCCYRDRSALVASRIISPISDFTFSVKTFVNNCVKYCSMGQINVET